MNQRVIKRKKKILPNWEKFLIKKGYLLSLTDHFHKRWRERFPQKCYLKDGEILELIQQSTPMFICKRKDYDPEYKEKNSDVFIVRNQEIVSLLCREKGTVITVYPYSTKNEKYWEKRIRKRKSKHKKKEPRKNNYLATYYRELQTQQECQ